MDGITMGRQPDGRNLRVVRSKAAIMEATRQAMQSGIFQPTVVNIAYAAGVSVRTVFQLYGGIESLRCAAIEDPDTERAILQRIIGVESQHWPIEFWRRVVIAAGLGRMPT